MLLMYWEGFINVVNQTVYNILEITLEYQISKQIFFYHFSIHSSIHLPMCPLIHLSIHSLTHVSIDLFVHPFIHSLIYLSIHSFIHPSIHKQHTLMYISNKQSFFQPLSYLDEQLSNLESQVVHFQHNSQL